MRIVLMVIMTIMVFVSGEARSSEPEIPGNSIRIIVPFSAGGPTDVLARVVGKILGDKLGVTAYIENKPGASGIIGTEPVVRVMVEGMDPQQVKAIAQRLAAVIGEEQARQSANRAGRA